MIPFLVRKLGYGLAVVFGVVSVTFVLLHLSGDPVAALAPPDASPAERDRLRERYGLDEPLPWQYVSYLGRVAQGDLGESWRQGRPALDAVLERLPETLALMTAALGLAALAGGALGLLAGMHPGGLADLAATGFALAGQAIPGFYLGTVLILVVAVRWEVLPPSGLDGPRSLVLPAVTLAAYPAATIARLLRGSLIEATGQDYIRTARSKGLTERVVIVRHALRNALLPALAFLGLQAGFLVGGAVVVEAVFAYPGLGSLAYGAAGDRDLPVIQATVLVVAVLIVLVNLAVDLLARWLDPRLRRADVVTGPVGGLAGAS